MTVQARRMQGAGRRTRTRAIDALEMRQVVLAGTWFGFPWTFTLRLRLSSKSAPSTPRTRRKRLRSLTPSEAGLNASDDDLLRSPLSKRKKLAKERQNASKLKESISPDEFGQYAPRRFLVLVPRMSRMMKKTKVYSVMTMTTIS